MNLEHKTRRDTHSVDLTDYTVINGVLHLKLYSLPAKMNNGNFAWKHIWQSLMIAMLLCTLKQKKKGYNCYTTDVLD